MTRQKYVGEYQNGDEVERGGSHEIGVVIVECAHHACVPLLLLSYEDVGRRSLGG